MRVDLGRGQVRVAEQLLDDAQVGAAVEQVGGERVAQGVRRDAHRQAGAVAEADRGGSAGRERRAARPWFRKTSIGRRVMPPARRSRRTGRPSSRYAPSAARAGRPSSPIRSLRPLPSTRISPRRRSSEPRSAAASSLIRRPGGVRGLDQGPIPQREGDPDAPCGRRLDPAVRRGRHRRRPAAARPARPRARAAAGAAAGAWRSRPRGRPGPGRCASPSDGTRGSRRVAARRSSGRDPRRGRPGRHAGPPAPGPASRRLVPPASRDTRRPRSRRPVGCARTCPARRGSGETARAPDRSLGRPAPRSRVGGGLDRARAPRAGAPDRRERATAAAATAVFAPPGAATAARRAPAGPAPPGSAGPPGYRSPGTMSAAAASLVDPQIRQIAASSFRASGPSSVSWSPPSGSWLVV